MARTIAFNAHTGEQVTLLVNDTVYHLNANGQYKHTMHRVRRIDEYGRAVTYCTIWMRHGAVLSSTQDAAVWCENGCKPLQPVEASN